MRRYIGLDAVRRLQKLGYGAIVSTLCSYRSTRYYRVYTFDLIGDDGFLELTPVCKSSYGETAKELEYAEFVLLSDIKAVLDNDIESVAYYFWAPKRLYRTRGLAY